MNERDQSSLASPVQQQRIARSERYQRALLDNFPWMVWLKDADSRFLSVNRPFAAAANLKEAIDLEGKTDLDVWPVDLAKHYRADDLEVMRSREKKTVQELVSVRGERRWFETYKAPVIGEDGEVFGTVGFARDISEAKAAEDAMLLRNASFAGVLRGESLGAVLDLALLSIEAEMPGWRLALCGAQGEGLELLAGPTLTGALTQNLRASLMLDTPLATVQRTRQPMILPSLAVDREWSVFVRPLLGEGVAAFAAAPLGEVGEQVPGVLAAFADRPGPMSESHGAAFTQGLQMLALLLRHHQVRQRLQESASSFRGIIDSMGDAMFVQSADGVFVDVNAAAERLTGYSASKLIGRHPRDLSAEGLNDLDSVAAAIALSHGGAASEFEFWLQSADERIFPTRVRLVAGHYYGEPVVIAVVADISAQRHAEFRLRVEHDLNRVLAEEGGRDRLLDVMLEIGLQFPEFDAGGVYLPTESGGLQLVRARGLSHDFAAQVDGFAPGSERVQTVDRGELICNCTDRSRHCSTVDFLTTPRAEREGLHCLAVVPIVSEGKVVACLNLAGHHSHRVSLFTFECLKQLASQCAQALARQALIDERQWAAVRQRMAASVFDNAHEGIMITDAKGRIVEVNATFTELTGYAREEAVGQMADLLKSGHHDADFYQAMWQSIRDQGYWQGEIWNRRKDGEIFVEHQTISAVRDEHGHILNYVGIFTDITLLKEHQERLEHLAHFDALTQLPNRMLLHDRMTLAMAQVERSGKHLVVAYLDLDGFKPVNDQYGHATGDSLLVEVGNRLRQCVRAGDTVARLGGDEFVLLFVGVDDEPEADRVVNRVLAAVSSPFVIQGHHLPLSASIGVTIFPGDPSDSDTLLRHADQAMYLAKQGGRNQSCLFDPESDRRARQRRGDVERMRLGLARGEFVLYYQPKVDMRQGKVLGVEALIRWQHPERGLLLPGTFLPAIEGSEFCQDLGNWVLSTALGQLMAWLRDGLDLSVSVNVSAEHLLAPDFLNDLQQMLAAYPELPPHHLEIEVLETAAIRDLKAVSSLFAACSELGVSFALDDFGTGYSSLTYFRHLPAEVMKIDQSFVADMLENPDDLAIVEGVIGLAEAFRRKVVAEGVETVEHGMVLMQLGCDVAQGFGVARPMPAEQVPGWVASFSPDPLWGSIAAFNWPREDLPLLIAEGDHRHWMRQLCDYVEGVPGAMPPSAMSPDQCRFGRWYHGEATQRYGHLDAFLSIESHHDEIHRLANEAIAAKQRGEPVDKSICAELEAKSAILTEAVELIQAEILVLHQTRRW